MLTRFNDGCWLVFDDMLTDGDRAVITVCVSAIVVAAFVGAL